MATLTTNFSHVGISVSDVTKAIDFYKNVLGWNHIAGSFSVKDSGDPEDFTRILYGRNGKEFGSFKLAHMTTQDSVGVELLEFEHGYDPGDDFDYDRHGIFHFGVQTPDVDELIEKVIANGGERVTPTKVMPCTDVMGHTIEYLIAFAKDPFGNIFEIYSYSYELQSKLPTKLG